MQEENNPYATPEAPITLEKSQSVIDGPQGIGGWLILPILGLFVSLFLWAGQVYEVVQVINSETWPALTELNSDSYHYMWQPILLFELVGQILFIPFIVYCFMRVFCYRHWYDGYSCPRYSGIRRPFAFFRSYTLNCHINCVG